jgi:DNA-directed RNA polymerase subunit beta
VVEVRVFSRRGVEKDERALAIEREEIERLAKDRDDELAILERSFAARLKDLLLNQTIVSGPKGLKGGGRVTQATFADFTPRQLAQIVVKNDRVMANIEELKISSPRAKNGCRSASRARSRSSRAATSCRPAS